MNKACLACQVHPDCRCTSCGERWCSECTLITNPGYKWRYNESELYMCIGCYRKSPMSRVKKSDVMSLRELHREVRRLIPKGYISVSADIQDHHPGHSEPFVEWNIYHEKLGHFNDVDQRKIYLDLCKKLGVEPKKPKNREDII